MKKIRTFLLEDDINFGSILRSYLELQEFSVQWVTDGGAAMAAFDPERFDLCILDVMLPNRDGFSVAREIRERRPDIPLVFLTAKSLREDVLKGYRIGADDYITKPFDTEVLLMKLRAIMRRGAEEEKEEEFSLGEYDFNYATRMLRWTGGEARLSPREADLLRLLALNLNTLMTRNWPC